MVKSTHKVKVASVNPKKTRIFQTLESVKCWLDIENREKSVRLGDCLDKGFQQSYGILNQIQRIRDVGGEKMEDKR